MSGASTNSIWSRPVRGTRGPTPTHGRDEIAAAGVELADAGGLDAVSMRAVAGALGMAAGSLYRHLSSRDDLLELMVDRCVGEMRPHSPDEGTWVEQFLLLARRQLALHGRHPWLADALTRRAAPGPNTLAHFDACLRILQPVPATTNAKFEAIAMVTGVVTLFARAATATGPMTFDHVDLATYPHLAAAFATPSPAPPPGDDLFDRTLRALLTGLLIADRP
ncbi:TetR/AcrR family transcriptional regulator [Micromonospora sp. WMMD1128]|uniref:TetR/AcrR family transcriptional regulator n=1 Tax=unclassified Micromonospora TaxID=2617518 RepID=UPI00248AE336|nr:MULTISPECIES: TetR/AcrR family transcriptional regulator [unclassified Micromonospora]WBB76287.1 TetR/AcrR family transcriptional regulator [Micromonospora sp. WMMD1128]WFE35927.1 TetR/AcrR family transcriptional regulator [Micromonospora sp. WMMD975]